MNSDETAIDSPTTGSSDNLDSDDLEEAENEADVDADAVEGECVIQCLEKGGVSGY